jgi:hypothetical protein
MQTVRYKKLNFSPAALSGGVCFGISGSVLFNVLVRLPHNQHSDVVAVQDEFQIVHCLDYV